MNKAKANVLKRMIGKRVIVIKDHIKNNYAHGRVLDCIGEDILKVEVFEDKTYNVNIFDIRSPSPDYP